MRELLPARGMQWGVEYERRSRMLSRMQRRHVARRWPVVHSAGARGQGLARAVAVCPAGPFAARASRPTCNK